MNSYLETEGPLDTGHLAFVMQRVVNGDGKTDGEHPARTLLAERRALVEHAGPELTYG